MFTDAHAHYEDEAFDSDRAEVLEKIQKAGCELVVDAASDVETSKKILELTRQNPFIYGAFGVHPSEASVFTDSELDIIESLAEDPKCVAIGEIGLDYHYDFSEKERQQEVFRMMLRLAKKLDKPFVIHDREAHRDVLDILEEEQVDGSKCLIHCFSGSREMAEICMKRGYFISIGGAVTFKNARRIHEVLSVVPLERILLETDCPYMTPEPNRGKRNDSSNIFYTALKIAEVKGVSYEEVCRQTSANTRAFYRIL